MGFKGIGYRTVYRLDGADRAVSRQGTGRERVRTLRFGDLPELYGVDLWSSGVDRSPLIFSALGLNPGRGLVSRDESGRIGGYLIQDTTTSPVRLGPFAAGTPETARALLLSALEVSGDAPVRVIATGPEGCPSHDLFREMGFVGQRDRLKMELGERPDGGGLVQYGTTPYMAT